MKIEVTERELHLIKEALLNNSVKYASQAMNKENVQLMGNEWAKNIMQKSDDMIVLLTKLK